MKKIVYSFLALAALVISSCSSDPCKDKSATTLCSGKGTLAASGDNCTCNCNAGSVGSDCSKDVAGNYAATDKLSGTGQTPYFPTITITGTVVSINNFTPFFFGGATKTVTGTISGNKITIPASNGGVVGGATIGGTGTITTSGNIVSIAWDGKGTISGVDLTWTATWTK
jgi:hypothetical protein